MNVEAIVSTVALMLVALACLAHIKEMGPRARVCERLGYSVTFGGSIGSALEWWWPWLDAYHADTVFVVGCGLVAFSIIARFVRHHWVVARGRWDGTERRSCTSDPFVVRQLDGVSFHPLDDH